MIIPRKYMVLAASTVVALLVLVTTLMPGSTVVAQGNDFSSDPDEFVDQMQDVFKLATDRNKAKMFIAELKEYMRSPDVSDLKKQEIIADCNLLKKRKGRPYPDYNLLISTLMKLNHNKHINGSNYMVWHEVLGAKLRNKSVPVTKINSYLTSTQFYADEGYISKSNGAAWRAYADNIEFRDEGDKLFLDITGASLVAYSQKDSIVLSETEGVLDFDAKKWHGNKGKQTWEVCDLPVEQTYATFGQYSIDMSKASYTIDSACFVNTNYFPYPLYGKIEHKVVSHKGSLSKTYPKFTTSDGQRREVKALFGGIDYEGGFSQIGERFHGSGTPDYPAEISIYRNDTLFITARAVGFAFFPNRIESTDTYVTVKLNDGEIIHTGLTFHYDDKNKEVSLIRGREGKERSNYLDTYHMVTFDVEKISWKVGTDFMTLGMLQGASRALALFESIDYYRQTEYYKMQGMALSHPFQSVKDFYRYNGGHSFTCSEYAQYLGADVNEVRLQMIQYSFDNFVLYDDNTDIVTPTKRLFNYLNNRLAEVEASNPTMQANPSLRNPKLANVDYDVMLFESNIVYDYEKEKGKVAPNIPNGVIDLRNYDIVLNGVTGISISDYHNIAFYPDSGKVNLKKNRDFKFSGRIEAGMINLVGDNFYFSYDNYNITLDNIRALKMKVITSDKDQYGQLVKADVENTICDLSGFLQIDMPNNKSGLRGRNPRYPELTSNKESKVYYDADYIQNGEYTRDKFYYTVDPFVFNDINNIQYGNTKFSGVLTSGIFPDIRHDLFIRPEDNSLGFVTNTADEGLPAYEGKATFFAKIDLSNAGLKGGGDLKYCTSVSSSKDFTFLPEHVYGETYNFMIEETTTGVTYPAVQIGNEQQVEVKNRVKTGTTEVEFHPFEDKLNVFNTVGRFLMFPNAKTSEYECKLSGELSVTPSGLRGQGESELPHEARIEASLMDFTNHSIVTDSTYFAQYKRDGSEVELVSDGLRRDLVMAGKNASEYNTSKARVQNNIKETNAALTENETFYYMESKYPSIMKSLNNRCMVSTIDFAGRFGAFKYKNDNGAEKEFNTIRFKTNVKTFTWDMDRNSQTIGNHGDVPGLKFVCTKKEADDDVEPLTFNVPYAMFDASNNVMTCEEVRYVNCADAKINLASDGIMIINEPVNRKSDRGREINIKPLKNTTIDIKSDSSYHQIYDAIATIKGAVDYVGDGNYDFYNKERVKYTIYMSEIKTQSEQYRDAENKKRTRYYTATTGRVRQNDINFDRHFAFRGIVHIKSGRQLLEWDGGVRMIHNAKNGPNGYAYFNSVIDPEKVRIPIAEKTYRYHIDNDEANKIENRYEIYKNFFMTKDNAHIYSAFTEDHETKGENPISILNSNGVLYYNSVFERFDIVKPYKIAKADTIGSIMSFIPGQNAMTGFGRLRLGLTELLDQTKAPSINITSAGDIRDDRNTGMKTVNSVLGIDFPLDERLSTMLYKKLLETKAAKCDTSNYRYELRMNELYDTTEIKQIKAMRWRKLDDVSEGDGKKKKGELHTSIGTDGSLFLFDNVFQTWYDKEYAYICDTTVNLMMMKNHNVNRKVHVRSEMITLRGQPRLYLEMSTDDGFWFFMYFKSGTTYILTSDKEFNVAMVDTQYNNKSKANKASMSKRAPDIYYKNFKKNFPSRTLYMFEEGSEDGVVDDADDASEEASETEKNE